MENRVSMVKGVCEFAKYRNRKLGSILRKSTRAKTIEHVFEHNLFDVAKILIPAVYPVVASSMLAIAAFHGFAQMFEYCLPFRDSAASDRDVIFSAARGGHMDIVRLIPLDASRASILLDHSFAHGKKEVVTYVHEKYPLHLPSSSSIATACAHGCFECVFMLPQKTIFPVACMAKAVKSKSADLVLHVSERFKTLHPKFEFDDQLLRTAIESGVSTIVMIVYSLGGFSNLSREMYYLLVEHNCREAISSLYKLGLPVYCDEMFQAAVEMCKVDILSDLLQHHEPSAELLQEIVPSGPKQEVYGVMNLLREHCLRHAKKKYKL
jgi:hypothetical protein